MSTAASSASAAQDYVTPFPWSQMIPLSLVLFNETLCMTVLFPFVGFFVSFLRGISLDEAGYFSGILLGVFMLGQILSAKTWGRLSDKYGRRFPLISGLFASGLAILAFGLSTSFWLCALFRFLQGLFNGNILVAKTMVADVTDKSNQAKGFALTGLTYGVGLVIGPVLGGFLYDPVHNLPWMHLSEDGFFSKRPAFLASLFVFLYSDIGMAICTLLLKESNLKAKPLPSIVKFIYPCLLKEAEFFVPPVRPDCEKENASDRKENEKNIDGVVEGEPGNPGKGSFVTITTTVDSKKNNDDCDPLEEELPLSSVHADEELKASTNTDDHALVFAPSTNVVIADMEPELRKFGYRQAFQHPATCFNLIMYMMFAGADCLVNEVVPLWAISSVPSGGFAFSSDKLGFLLLLNAIPSLTGTFTFSTICAKYEDKAKFFRLGMFIFTVSVFFLPLVYYLPHGVVATTMLVLFQAGRQLSVCWCFALCTMFTARSAPEKFIGAAMGISQSSCAFCRAIVPLIFMPLFSWSISGSHIYPFNHCLVFIIAAIFSFLCWVRMYTVSTTPEAKIVILDGGYKEAYQRIVQRFKSLVCS